MKDSIMKNKSILAVDSQMALLPTLEEGILVVPSIEQSSKSECVQRNECVLKKLDGILGFFPEDFATEKLKFISTS